MLYIAKNLMGQQIACALNEFELRNIMNLQYPKTAYSIERIALMNNKFAPTRHKNWKHTTKRGGVIMREIDRILFVSLNADKFGMYYVLNDGNFVEKFYAESDDEAIERFRSNYGR